MWQNFINLRSWLVDFTGANLTQSASFLAQQNKWMRAMIDDHPSDEDDYWRHVAYYVAQLDGLYDGYRAAASPDWVSHRCNKRSDKNLKNVKKRGEKRKKTSVNV